MSVDPLAVADELAAAFERIRERMQASGELTVRPMVAPLRLVMTYGLAAQAYDVAQDATRSIREERYGATPPLVRVVFECGVYAQWLVIEPSAADAMAAEAHRQRRALADSMARARQFLNHAESVRAAAGPPPNTPPAVSAKRFERVCEQVDPGGNLYVMYRMLCGDDHAGVPVVERWFDEIPGPPGLGWRPDPPPFTPGQRLVLAHTLALSLLWAAAGFDQMLQGRPLARPVDAAKAKLGHGGKPGVHKLVLPPAAAAGDG